MAVMAAIALDGLLRVGPDDELAGLADPVDEDDETVDVSLSSAP